MLHLRNVVLLRHFDTIGTHTCGLTGEDSDGISNHLMPYNAQVVVGMLDKLACVWGCVLKVVRLEKQHPEYGSY